MGTSQAINPSVNGNPKWGNLGRALSFAVNSSTRSEKQLNNIMHRFVEAVGGSNIAGSGNSKVFGKAGITTLNNFLGFISNARQNGIREALNSIGMPSFENASVDEVVNYLINHCTGGTASLDETAAKSANDKLLEELLNTAENIDDVEAIFDEMEVDYFYENICKFFTYYIVEFSTQLFEEKIFSKLPMENHRVIFEEMRHYIMEKLRDLQNSRNLITINWTTNEGLNVIKEIQIEILEVFE